MVYPIRYPELASALLLDLQRVLPDIESYAPLDWSVVRVVENGGYSIGQTRNSSVFSLREIAALVVRDSTKKRWIGEGSISPQTPNKEERESLAIEGFLERNETCLAINDDPPWQRLNAPPLDDFTNRCLQAAQDWVQYDFLWRELEDSISPLLYDNAVPVKTVARNMSIGNGKSVGNPWNDFLGKLVDGPITYANPAALALFPALVNQSVLLFDEEGRRRAERPGRNRWSRLVKFQLASHRFSCVEGGRISCVPKSCLIDRTIGSEPIIESLIQQGLGTTLRSYLLRYGIDLSHQQAINRELAKQGSLHGDTATMDLKGASDNIALALVEKLFPRDWKWWFDVSRVKNATLPDGSVVPLHMLSSMGNGFTFPIQTVIFLALAIGTATTLGIDFCLHGPGRNLSVYGDDIIIPVELFAPLSLVLEYVGFTVNTDKSYAAGPFRESCGEDYLNGNLIRGVYVEKLNTLQDIAAYLNRLFRFGALHNITFPNVFATLSGNELLLVPLEAPEDSGLRCSYAYLTFREALGTAPLVERNKIVTRGSYVRRHTMEFYFMMWRPRAQRFSVVQRVKGVWSLTPRFVSLYDGVMLAQLYGAVDNGRCSYRDDSRVTTYEQVGVGCAGWHLDPPGGIIIDDDAGVTETLTRIMIQSTN